MLTKVQKQKILDELKDKISRQKIMIFLDFTGLKVKDLFNLRKKLKSADNELKVAKKTLMRLAFKEKKVEIDLKKMKGEIALVFGLKDEFSPAKIVYQFSRENENLKILGGFFEAQFREVEEIITLATVSSRKELLAKLVGSIAVPISGFVNVLQAPLEACIFIIRSLGENKIGK